MLLQVVTDKTWFSPVWCQAIVFSVPRLISFTDQCHFLSPIFSHSAWIYAVTESIDDFLFINIYYPPYLPIIYITTIHQPCNILYAQQHICNKVCTFSTLLRGTCWLPETKPNSVWCSHNPIPFHATRGKHQLTLFLRDNTLLILSRHFAFYLSPGRCLLQHGAYWKLRLMSKMFWNVPVLTQVETINYKENQ